MKDKLWTDICNNKAESFEGFSISIGIPAEYFFYYLPAAWIAVYDDPNYFDVVYRSLVAYKFDQRWRNYLAALTVDQINTLIIFLKKCQSSVDMYKDVMEVDILIEALEGLLVVYATVQMKTIQINLKQ